MRSLILACGLIAALLAAGCSQSGKSSEAALSASNAAGVPGTDYVAPDARGIQTLALKTVAIPEYLELPAHIEADPTRVVHVFTLAGGRITEMKVRPWDRVQKGQPLAKLESSDLSRAVADYQKARVDSEVKQKAFARAEDLLAHYAIAEKDYQQAQGDAQMAQAEQNTARERIRVLGADPDHPTNELQVVAPRAGVILDVLLQRGEQSLPALRELQQKVKALNGGLLPRGMHLVTLYDRTDLIHLTTATVRHVVILGLVLVTLILYVFLGDVPVSLIAALTIPCSLLFAFSVMVLSGGSANLISIGAIDFGILVDASVIVLEDIYRRFQAAGPDASTFDLIASATAESARPVLFSVLVIIVALIPLFTMQGVPGKIFAPMSETYGFALTGALLFAILFAPVLASWLRPERVRAHHTRIVVWLGKHYAGSLKWVCAHRKTTLAIAAGALAGTLVLGSFLGGEFMPKLEEGNLWLRATLPQDVSFEGATKMARDIREILLTFPSVQQVVSQMGRPDDGTDVTTFNNLEFMVSLKNPNAWPAGLTKDELIRRMDAQLEKFPGVDFNFSQNIQDNVEEAMSGVKGENSLKLFGDDIDVLVEKAAEIRDVMRQVPGVADLAVLQETGQPELLVSINRAASARYGLMAADLNAAVQAAIGGLAPTEILEGDRRFDFVIRYQPEFRRTPEAIRNILIPTPDGNRIPLGQVAEVSLREGAFMIYRENGRRYIPVKFSVRGRDLAGTISEVQARLAKKVHIPEDYHYKWAGEYDSLQKEQQRLAIILPISLLIILGLLFTAFNSLRHALLVLAILPFGLIGGVISLLVTHTPFSISAAVGFASVVGVCTLGGVVFVSGIRRKEKECSTMLGAIELGGLAEMRPVIMACAAAGLGLLPAAVSSGIGVQAQQPLARVVVGGMITSPFAILFLIPVLASYWLQQTPSTDLTEK